MIDSAVKAGARTLDKYILIKPDPVKQITELFDVARRQTQSRRDLWIKLYQAYNGYVKSDSRSYGRANFHFHKLFQQIEAETARFILNYFGHTPFTTVSPTKGDSVDGAKALEDILQYYFEHAPSFFYSKLRKVKYTLMYGTAFTIPTWRRETAKIKRQIPVNMYGVQVGVEEIETEEVVYEGLHFETYSPSEVYVDPYALSIEDARWVIVQEWTPAEELYQKAKEGVYDLSKVKNIPLTGDGQESMEYKKRMQSLGYPVPEMDIGMIRNLHYFSKDRFYTVANSTELIRDIPNPFWHRKIPMTQGIKTLDPDSFYPIGSARMLLPNQKMTNLMVNSMIDSVVSTIHPVWKYKSKVDPHQLMSLPNNKIRVQNLDDVDVMRMPEMKQDLLQVKALFDENAEEITGYFKAQKGGGLGGQPNTATSDAIFQSEGDKRIQFDTMVFEELSLLKEAKMCSKLIQQMMPEGQEFRINGAGGLNFVRYSPADIRGEYDFQVSGSRESLNRAVVQQQLINFYATSSNANQYVRMADGSIIPVPVLDVYNALKDIYEGFGKKNVDKLLYRPELFGVPITNEVLGQYGLPSIPGLENMQSNPNTGSLSRGDAGKGGGVSRSVNEKNVINSANRIKPQGLKMF